jgi:hypothetical protein
LTRFYQVARAQQLWREMDEQFGEAEPWKQILDLLQLSCTREELLGALDALRFLSPGRINEIIPERAMFLARATHC